MSNPAANSDARISGQIVAAFGRSYLVETAGGLVSCVPRGKRSDYACGDIVGLKETGDREGVIESIQPRSSLLLRSAAHRQKLIAANVTQVAIIVAAEPSFSDELIARVQVAAENAGIDSFIVLNKSDLLKEAALALQRLASSQGKLCSCSEVLLPCFHMERLGVYELLPQQGKNVPSPIYQRSAKFYLIM